MGLKMSNKAAKVSFTKFVEVLSRTTSKHYKKEAPRNHTLESFI